MPEEKIKEIFFCKDCWLAWDLEDGPECPKCRKVVDPVPWYWRNLVKMQGRQTGPKTLKGKRKAEINLRTHNAGPGPEASKYTRLNRVTHGRYLKVSALYPAKIGKYSDCLTCPVRERCEEEKWKYCPQKTDKIYEFQAHILAALKNNNLEAMDEYAGLTMAKAHAIMQDMFENIFKYGTMYPEMKTDSDGETMLKRLVANPMLEVIPKYINLLGMTAQDRKLTQKQQGEMTPDTIMEAIKKLFAGETDAGNFNFDPPEELKK